MSDFVRKLVGFEYSLLHPSPAAADSGDAAIARPGSPWSVYRPPARTGQDRPIAAITTVSDPRDGLRVWGTSSVSMDLDGFSIIAGRSASIGVTLLLTGLVRKYDGTLESIGPEGKGFYFTLRGDRTIGSQVFNFPLTQGEIVALNVAQPTLAQNLYTTFRGQVWVSVQRTRLLPDNTLVPVQTLIANYVSTNEPCSWPAMPLTNPRDGIGYYRRVTITTTAVYPTTTLPTTAPPGAEWEILDCSFRLVTSASNVPPGAGFRTPVIQWGVGGRPYLTFGLQIAANEGATFFVGPSISAGSDAFNLNSQAIMPGYRLINPSAGVNNPSGDAQNFISINIVNMQPGDFLDNLQYDVVERLTADA